MNAKNGKWTVKTLAAALLAGGLAITGAATIGCGRMSKEQIAASSLELGVQAGDPRSVTDATELYRRIALNHNETFLVDASA